MRKLIKIKGMSCEHCKAAVEKALIGVLGVSSAVADYVKGEAVLELTEVVSDQLLVDAITKNTPFEVIGIRAI